ncbi:MAG: DUF1996 domain-containing protein [Dermatophilaceae bacterium]
MRGLAVPRRAVLLAVALLLLAVESPISAAPAEAAAKGMFKVVCDFSHSLMDDPIVYPGKPDASHLHEFSGNTTTDANSTLDSLQNGSTTCGNAKDRSAYWAPALYQDGKRVEPKEMQIYYRASNRDAGSINTIPMGLKMIAGNRDATQAQSADIAGWTCTATSPTFTGTIPTCTSGQKLRNRIRFPECWDGKNLDSADHKQHMSYLVGGSCPASHPVAIPRVDIEVHYGYITGGANDVRLSSGSWTSLHGDFWNAWDPATLQALVRKCLVGTQICSTV